MRLIIAMKPLGGGVALFRLECGHDVATVEASSAAMLRAMTTQTPVDCVKCDSKKAAA